MPLDKESQEHLKRLQSEAMEILEELADMMPPDYRITLLVRNTNNIEDADIVLTNDYLGDSIAALEKNQAKMENAG